MLKFLSRQSTVLSQYSVSRFYGINYVALAIKGICCLKFATFSTFLNSLRILHKMNKLTGLHYPYLSEKNVNHPCSHSFGLSPVIVSYFSNSGLTLGTCFGTNSVRFREIGVHSYTKRKKKYPYLWREKRDRNLYVSPLFYLVVTFLLQLHAVRRRYFLIRF